MIPFAFDGSLADRRFFPIPSAPIVLDGHSTGGQDLIFSCPAEAKEGAQQE